MHQYLRVCSFVAVLCCLICSAPASAAYTTIWSDGFSGSLSNWSVVSGYAYSTAQNHGTYTGAGTAGVATAACQMWRSGGTRPFAECRVSGYFWDGKGGWKAGICGWQMRTGLRLTEPGGSAALFLDHGIYTTPGYNTYNYRTVGEGGIGWTANGSRWSATNCNPAWIYFETTVNPGAPGASPVGTVTFKATDGGGSPTKTVNLTSNFYAYGVGRVYLGFNLSAAAGTSHYWDDVVLQATAPGTPTIGAATANTTSQITWTWTRADNNLFGFDVADNASAIKAPQYPNSGWVSRGATSWSETGLAANTQYTRKVRAWNGALNSNYSATASKYTLQNTPTAPTFSSLTETGFRVSTTGPVNLTAGSSGVIFHDGAADRTKVTVLYEDLTGLTANTQYTYKAKGVNGEAVATAYSGTTSVYTLANVPTLNTNVATTAGSEWYNAASWPGFTNPQGFGTGGKVSKFKYKWSTNASDSITENEGTDWATGTMTTTPPADGAEWYLYLRSYNGDSKGNGSTKLGPFKYDATAPNAAPAYSTGASTTGIVVNFGASSGDNLSGLATAAYKVTRGAYDSGWVTSGPVTDPAPDIADGGSATYTVTTIDNAGNQATDTVSGRKPLAATNNWVFTTKAVSLAPPGLYPQQLAANTKVFASSDSKVYGFGGAAASALWVPVATGGAVQGRVIPATLAGELTALAGSQDGKVYARKVSDGTARWTHDFGGTPTFKVTAKPAGVIGVTVNGSYTGDVVFAATDAPNDLNMLRAFQAGDGTVLWTYSATLGPILGSPLVLPSKGLVVFATMPGGSDAGRVVAVKIADGTMAWQQTAVGDVRSAVSPDGAEATVFAVNQSGQLYALDSSNGTAKSGFPVSVGATGIYGAPMWHGNGPRLYVSSLGDTFYALNPANGGTATGWSSSVSVTGPSNPVVFNQRVYVGSADGNLYEYNINTGAQTGYRAIGSTVGDPVVDAWLSRIYVGAGDGRIYSFSLPF